MPWVNKNSYYKQNDGWTISKSYSQCSVLPYGLHEGNKTIGFFTTEIEAKNKYNELIKDKL